MVVSLHETDGKSRLKGLRAEDCLDRAARPCLDDRKLRLDAKPDTVQLPFDLRVGHGTLETFPNGDRPTDRELRRSIPEGECLGGEGDHRVVGAVTAAVVARQREGVDNGANLALKIGEVADNPCLEFYGV